MSFKNNIEQIYKVRALVKAMGINEEVRFKKCDLSIYKAAQIYWTAKSRQRYHIEPGKPLKSTMIKRIEDAELRPSQIKW